jgi:hypothetical protein
VSGRRLAAVVVAVAALAAGGCGGSAGRPSAGWVPDDTLVYASLNTEPGSDTVKDAAQVLARLPSWPKVRPFLERSLRGFGAGAGVSLPRDVRPWLGDEAAVALAPQGGGQAGTLFVLDVRDETGAREFLQRLGNPNTRVKHAGTDIDVYGDQATALADGHLLAGPLSLVEKGLDAHEGDSPALTSRDAFRAAIKDAPGDRVAEAYVSARGLKGVVAARGGGGALLAGVLSPPGIRGAFLSLRAAGKAATVTVHEALAGGRRGFLPSTFSTAKAGEAPGAAAVFLEARRLDRVVDRLASRALASAGAGVRDTLGPLVRRRTQVSLLPRGGGSAALLVTAAVPSERKARERLASLQAGLGQALGATAGAAGAAPVVNERTVAGTAAFQLRVTPTFEVDYAVDGGRVLLATDLPALAAGLRGKTTLRETPAWKSVTGDLPDEVTSVGFLDPGRLLPVLEGSGLTRSQQYLAVRDDLRRLRAIGLSGKSGEGETTSEITLSIP